MSAYNPNDELRAIVQRKQYEVKSLLAQHSDENDPLQVSDKNVSRKVYIAPQSIGVLALLQEKSPENNTSA